MTHDSVTATVAAGDGATLPPPVPAPSLTEEVGGAQQASATANDVVPDLVADAARVLADEPTLQQTLERAVELAVKMVDGCESAGVSLVTRGRIESPAVSDALVARGDELQYELGEGPCLDAVRDHAFVESPDVAADDRWSVWGPKVRAELGVRSMLCVQLYTSSTAHGALNLYSSEPDRFGHDAQQLATTFAAVAAAAISAARTEDQLQSAVQTRTLIGQAQGIVMERYSLTAARAFAVLSRVSQDANIKLVDIAREIVLTRRIPGVPEKGAGSDGRSAAALPDAG
ncbi:GAF and ANTAR domain-containing protein [Cellulosimicrobium arenosum]|uniref:GAF and ANTAR domain-containing protein n=1 Tax=Cellulosimicrobium arenosum TaxID=2708133 RepID=A0A927IYS2_9MICO|nr:GAF and ANTAR domain-containing protein [Cellulosimicrobium arenosum]MBD8078711.1 GAF and ANTAR domain-containing protein [Cellulosimicrobium arenosum]